MPTENERKDVQNAMAYDLLKIFKEAPGKSYTYEELEKLIDAYISGLKQKNQHDRQYPSAVELAGIFVPKTACEIGG